MIVDAKKKCKILHQVFVTIPLPRSCNQKRLIAELLHLKQYKAGFWSKKVEKAVRGVNKSHKQLGVNIEQGTPHIVRIIIWVFLFDALFGDQSYLNIYYLCHSHFQSEGRKCYLPLSICWKQKQWQNLAARISCQPWWPPNLIIRRQATQK